MYTPPPPPGFCCISKALIGTVVLVFVATYITKWIVFEQPVDTFDSWRIDEEFWLTLPYVIGVTLCAWIIH